MALKTMVVVTGSDVFNFFFFLVIVSGGGWPLMTLAICQSLLSGVRKVDGGGGGLVADCGGWWL